MGTERVAENAGHSGTRADVDVRCLPDFRAGRNRDRKHSWVKGKTVMITIIICSFLSEGRDISFSNAGIRHLEHLKHMVDRSVNEEAKE